MKFKQKALVAVFAAAATLGVVGCDNHKSASQPQQTNVTQTATQAATPAPAAAPAQHKGDTPDEKAAKIAKMEGTDIARLKAMGYTVNADIGKGTANADFTDLVDGKWHGNSTTFEYAITLNDHVTKAKVLVEHHNFVPTIHNPIKLQ